LQREVGANVGGDFYGNVRALDRLEAVGLDVDFVNARFEVGSDIGT
jgi:hypothetical protein